jgi:hypothetical protein
VVGSFCPSTFTVELHYPTPWGTENLVAREFNTNGGQTQQGQLVIPGVAIRAIYVTATTVPTFRYWFVSHWGGIGCNIPEPCNESYRSPANTDHTVTVLHHIDLQVMNPAGTAPINNMEWSFAYYPAAATAAPAVVSTGHTASDGKIAFNITPTVGMFNAVDDAHNGLLNVMVQGSCIWTVAGCVDTDSTINRAVGAVEEVYTFVYNAVINLKNTAYDAAVSGLGTIGTVPERSVKVWKYDSSGDFKPEYAQCDSDQSCNSGNDQSSTTPGACPWDGYGLQNVTDKWSAIQEGHTDYGAQVSYSYGASSDSTWTVGFKAGSGNAWSVSGAAQMTGKWTTQEGSDSPPNTSPLGWTRQRWGVRVRYGLYVSQATRYKEGHTDQAYCDRVWWVQTIKRLTPDDDPGSYSVALGYYGTQDNGSGTANPTPDELTNTDSGSLRMRDRCWGTCTNGNAFFLVDNQYAYHLSTDSVKSEFTSIGGCIWAFCGGYSSGWSNLSKLTWTVGNSIRSCGNGWKFYYDGNKNPAAQGGTPNTFVDAGAAGPGYHTSSGGGSYIADGC